MNLEPVRREAQQVGAAVAVEIDEQHVLRASMQVGAGVGCPVITTARAKRPRPRPASTSTRPDAHAHEVVAGRRHSCRRGRRVDHRDRLGIRLLRPRRERRRLTSRPSRDSARRRCSRPSAGDASIRPSPSASERRTLLDPRRRCARAARERRRSARSRRGRGSRSSRAARCPPRPAGRRCRSRPCPRTRGRRASKLDRRWCVAAPVAVALPAARRPSSAQYARRRCVFLSTPGSGASSSVTSAVSGSSSERRPRAARRSTKLDRDMRTVAPAARSRCSRTRWARGGHRRSRRGQRRGRPAAPRRAATLRFLAASCVAEQPRPQATFTGPGSRNERDLACTAAPGDADSRRGRRRARRAAARN